MTSPPVSRGAGTALLAVLGVGVLAHRSSPFISIRGSALSHRKPRQRASKSALRAGVAGGFLSTIAVAGAAGPAQAEPVTQTIEMPTIASNFSAAAAASAQATQQLALDIEKQANEDAAAAKAAKDAKKAHAEAVRKDEAKKKAEAAEKKAKAEAEAKERAERACRSTERTTLSASTGSYRARPPRQLRLRAAHSSGPEAGWGGTLSTCTEERA
ncbi:hypothetical protein SCALM49S_02838 [Streptomyces californicus]